MSVPAQSTPGLKKNELAGAVQTATKVRLNTFGSLEIRSNSGGPDKKWRRVFLRWDEEKTKYDDCLLNLEKCPAKFQQWRLAVERIKGLQGAEMLAAVNREINYLVTYASDKQTSGQGDQWSTPMETLSNAGDCEDYAILKYATLHELGVPEARMRIVIVMDKVRNVAHAVLAVRSGERIDILDNQRVAPEDHQNIKEYKPLYSVNRHGRWLNLKVRKRAKLLSKASQTSN